MLFRAFLLQTTSEYSNEQTDRYGETEREQEGQRNILVGQRAAKIAEHDCIQRPQRAANGGRGDEPA